MAKPSQDDERTRPATPARGQAWRALASPAYRRYFFGQLLSLVGTWIQQVALGWLVYRLTDSTVLLGAVAFLSNAPQLLVAPFAGIVIDRSDRKRLMLQIQTLMLAQAIFLAVFTYFNWLEPWLILVAAGVLGVLNSFDAPLRHSLAGQLVGRRDDIPNAIALNTLTFNVARFVGPPTAGLLLAATSAAVCFAVNGVSFLALILALRRIDSPSSRPSPASFRSALREGLAYVRGSVPVRMLLIQVALVNFFAASYLPMMPAFARDVFQGGPNTLGVLLGSAGAGALVASVYLMSRPSVRGLTGSILHASVLAGTALIGFALTAELWLALVQLFLLGFSMIVCNASSNTILQTILPEGLRGRVLALYTAANLGAAAVGGLAVGWVADAMGPDAALLSAGLLLVAVGVRFSLRLEFMRVHLRPLYAAQGVAPRTID